METIVSRIPMLLAIRRCVDVDQQAKVVMPNKFERLGTLAVGEIPRRSVLQLLVLHPLLLKSDAVAAAKIPEMQELDVIRILKFPSGVKIQEIFEGEGTEAREGDLVEINYVCRRSNGYFVHSTVDQFSGESAPVIFPLGDKRVIQGLSEVFIGMRVGGKRRALIPPSVGYVSEDQRFVSISPSSVEYKFGGRGGVRDCSFCYWSCFNHPRLESN